MNYEILSLLIKEFDKDNNKKYDILSSFINNLDNIKLEIKEQLKLKEPYFNILYSLSLHYRETYNSTLLTDLLNISFYHKDKEISFIHLFLEFLYDNYNFTFGLMNYL